MRRFGRRYPAVVAVTGPVVGERSRAVVSPSSRVAGCGLRVGPALAGVAVASGAGVLSEVVVGGLGDLGDGACRCRGALGGGWGQAAGGGDPLDVAGVHEPSPPGRRQSAGRRQAAGNGGGIDGDALRPSHHGAKSLACRSGPAKVDDDGLRGRCTDSPGARRNPASPQWLCRRIWTRPVAHQEHLLPQEPGSCQDRRRPSPPGPSP